MSGTEAVLKTAMALLAGEADEETLRPLCEISKTALDFDKDGGENPAAVLAAASDAAYRFLLSKDGVKSFAAGDVKESYAVKERLEAFSNLRKSALEARRRDLPFVMGTM